MSLILKNIKKRLLFTQQNFFSSSILQMIHQYISLIKRNRKKVTILSYVLILNVPKIIFKISFIYRKYTFFTQIF